MNYKEVQQEVIKLYNVNINTNSTCWSRTHVHVDGSRMICKWESKSSIKSTFTLLHEIGHLENNKSWMRRYEEEYYATVWAIEQCDKYGLHVPESLINKYQDYIDITMERGIRRGGKNYKRLVLPHGKIIEKVSVM